MGIPRRTGRVTMYHQRGFGFIEPDAPGDTEEPVFFHISQVLGESEPLTGDRVSFFDGVGKNGKPCANHVEILQ
jgi:cold shock CspA family protein